MTALFIFLSVAAGCAELTWCGEFGGCFRLHNECLPIAQVTRDLACAFTSGCQSSGLCTLVAGRCVASRDAECRRAQVCTGVGDLAAPAGRCFAVDGACVSKRFAGFALVELSAEVRSCSVVVCGKTVLTSGDRVPIGTCMVELDCHDAHYEQRLPLRSGDRVVVGKQKASVWPQVPEVPK